MSSRNPKPETRNPKPETFNTYLSKLKKPACLIILLSVKYALISAFKLLIPCLKPTGRNGRRLY
jgi:hypothetical protein